MATGISSELLKKMDAYWRAANYLSVGQIYLLANPLLREPLRLEHVKPRLLGHWGTTPGLNFVYVHMNRAIVERDLDAIYVIGPGHGGPGIVANAYLEGTYSEVYPASRGTKREFGACSSSSRFQEASRATSLQRHRAASMKAASSATLCRTRSARRSTTRSLLVCCVVGDGEAETGPLATSWHSNKFLNPESDGAVLPILHLNGYKIAGPTVLARIPRAELDSLLRGYGWAPRFVEGDNPAEMHAKMASALDDVLDEIRRIQGDARQRGITAAPLLADDRSRDTQGVDRAEGGRRGANRGDVPRAPGSARCARREAGAPPASRTLDEELSTRGALRRTWRARSRACGAAAEGRAAHEREPARERRAPPRRAPRAGFSQSTRSMYPRPGRPKPRRRAYKDGSCATCLPRTLTRGTSAFSAPTRRPRTAGTRSSR